MTAAARLTTSVINQYIDLCMSARNAGYHASGGRMTAFGLPNPFADPYFPSSDDISTMGSWHTR